MDGPELAVLIDERLRTLQRLHDISSQQMDAITSGRMNHLMQLLSDKQEPLNRLASLAEQIRVAVGDDPESRTWESELQRQQCRQAQAACERLHHELFALEGACGEALRDSRATLQRQLGRLDSVRAAANGYAARVETPCRGATLDLTSG